MRNKTGPERWQYGHSGVRDKLGRGAFSNLQPDTGERIPFNPQPGLLQQMRELREARRLRGGKRGRFLLDEVPRVESLAKQAAELGWTWREIGRALGVTEVSAKNYAKRAGML